MGSRSGSTLAHPIPLPAYANAVIDIPDRTINMRKPEMIIGRFEVLKWIGV
jgi:hypothetical protein